jgi:RNA ligase (TIGR02306 family)
MVERKMATVREIGAINPIEGADQIEVASVGGWKVVVKKGEFKAGDFAIYCEIDSFIPTSIAPFLTKPGHYPAVFDGIEGERLRTVRLRKQISQGLLLPLSVMSDRGHTVYVVDGIDVSECLGITKYEAPLPAQLAGEAKGMFPSFIPKTDQERIQNLTNELAEWTQPPTYLWEVTEKLDGSSMTVYLRDDDFGVCSRNLDLKRNEDNTFWKVSIKNNLEEILKNSGGCYALQGELIGEGIQGNPYKFKGQDMYIFDIYDIGNGRYLTPVERAQFVSKWKLNHVPVLNAALPLMDATVDSLLAFAEADSVMGDITGPTREGLVFKRHDGMESFKAISNKFLMKTGG